MKNTHVEYLKRRAKQYHRTRHGETFEGGMKIFHRYDDLSPDRLSWWDDVTFIMNDYRVALAWHHPRMAFEDAIDEEVDRLTSDIARDSWIRDGSPVYKKVGKSRKKMTHTAYNPPLHDGYYEQWQETRQKVMQSFDVDIRPSLQSSWCQFSRIVYLCVPVEVRNKMDLQQLVAMTRRLLKRETTLPELFPDYQYTREDWVQEGLNMAKDALHIDAVE